MPCLGWDQSSSPCASTDRVGKLPVLLSWTLGVPGSVGFMAGILGIRDPFQSKQSYVSMIPIAKIRLK